MAVLVGVLILSGIFGRSKGVVGGLVGGFIGAFVAAGMAGAADSGDIVDLYSPAEVAASVLPVVAVAAVLAFAAPYVIGFASLGWGVGAFITVIATARSGWIAYVGAFTLHLLVAAFLVWLARRRVLA